MSLRKEREHKNEERKKKTVNGIKSKQQNSTYFSHKMMEFFSNKKKIVSHFSNKNTNCLMTLADDNHEMICHLSK